MARLATVVVAAVALLAASALARRSPVSQKIEKVLDSSRVQVPGFAYGYLNANITYDVDYFYWMFAPTDGNTSAPLVLWLTGGPGCSSELALFFENGPYTVNPDGVNLTPNPYGWNQHAYLLYVDQPGGTGFSTVGNPNGYVTSEETVAQDFYTFLTNFFKKFPQFVGRPFFVTGESYGGHYVPAISAYIVNQNKAGGPLQINLQGVAVGNGLVDPLIQDGYYGPYLLAMGLISSDENSQVQQQYTVCANDITSGDYQSAFNDCGQVIGLCLQFAGNINVYNVQEQCTFPPLCYNFTNVVNYMNLPAVQSQLGVSGITWQACDSTVYSYLISDFEHNFRRDMPVILNAGVPLVVYNGEDDFICNWYGTQAYLRTMKWSGQQQWLSSQNTTWTVGGVAAGSYKTANGLTFLRVTGAGHMVPHDQPAAALDLINRLILGKWK